MRPRWSRLALVAIALLAIVGGVLLVFQAGRTSRERGRQGRCQRAERRGLVLMGGGQLADGAHQEEPATGAQLEEERAQREDV